MKNLFRRYVEMVGLLLGSGASVYFWDVAQKERAAHQEERNRIMAEKRTMEDTLVLVQDTLNNLAYGKIRNIPQIEKDIKQVKAEAERKRQKVKRYFSSRRENLLKKAPPGDKLDRSLEKLNQEVDKRMSDIAAVESRKLKPYAWLGC